MQLEGMQVPLCGDYARHCACLGDDGEFYLLTTLSFMFCCFRASSSCKASSLHIHSCGYFPVSNLPIPCLNELAPVHLLCPFSSFFCLEKILLNALT